MIEINIDPMTTCENHPRDGAVEGPERQDPLLGGSLSAGQNSEQGAWWGSGCHTMRVRRSQTEMTLKKADVTRPSPG
jgi:hypothetical protein